MKIGFVMDRMIVVILQMNLIVQILIHLVLKRSLDVPMEIAYKNHGDVMDTMTVVTCQMKIPVQVRKTSIL